MQLYFLICRQFTVAVLHIFFVLVIALLFLVFQLLVVLQPLNFTLESLFLNFEHNLSLLDLS